MFTLLGTLIVGCGKTAYEEKLIGKWENDDGVSKLTLELRKQGKWSWSQVIPKTKLDWSASGTWKLEGRTLVRTTQASTVNGKSMEAQIGSVDRVEIVRLDGSALVLRANSKDGHDIMITFHRVT